MATLYYHYYYHHHHHHHRRRRRRRRRHHHHDLYFSIIRCSVLLQVIFFVHNKYRRNVQS